MLANDSPNFIFGPQCELHTDTPAPSTCLALTSDCLMVTKRLRISRRTAMANLRVLSWQEQSSTSASPSTACSTVEWGPRSAGILRAELACSS